MKELRWFPGQYRGFGVKESRIYLTSRGHLLCILVRDLAADYADPIAVACGLRYEGDGREHWCVAPLLSPDHPEASCPSACFDSLPAAEEYIASRCDGESSPCGPPPPIDEDEFYRFVRFVAEELDGLGGMPPLNEDPG